MSKTTKYIKPTIIHHEATKTMSGEDLEEFNSRLKKVAAYARVSTEREEQESSFKNQVEYFYNKINGNKQWLNAGVFGDEGVSGLFVKNRKDFNRMIEDARAGKIDQIIVKNASRLGRNALEIIKIARELREKGVDIYLERENIHSIDPEQDIFFALSMSYAQSGSQRISDNVQWINAKKREAGIVDFPTKNFLGYGRNKRGKIIIVEKEAAVVREIYDLYLAGNSSRKIAKMLEQKGYRTPGNKTKWNGGTILNILRNEKYIGDALLGKTFSESFLSEKRIKNTGQRDMRYVENSHPAIIDRQTYIAVQQLLKKGAPIYFNTTEVMAC